MPPSQDPHHKELAVSQVLLILIGSGITYCQGEWDCHGPTGMGAGGGEVFVHIVQIQRQIQMKISGAERCRDHKSSSKRKSIISRRPSFRISSINESF